MLAIPDNSRKMKVFNVTSSQELGCVWIQNRRMIKFVSWQLRPYKRNYLTDDLELAEVIHAMKI